MQYYSFYREKKLAFSDSTVWSPRPYTIFKLLLSARFCSAFLSNISDCDETFNYWEPVSTPMSSCFSLALFLLTVVLLKGISFKSMFNANEARYVGSFFRMYNFWPNFIEFKQNLDNI